MKILVTGANGQLGRLVIKELSKLSQGHDMELVAGVRSIDKAKDLMSNGIRVVQINYDDPTTFASSLEGIDRLLLISSSEVGERVRQHANVITAAKANRVQLIAYTSILHGHQSPLLLAGEHQQTEKLLASSGVPYVLLRNGWYTENYLMSLPQVLSMGQLFGCAGNGLLSLATRADYAAAAATVLLSPNPEGKIYELAGDVPCTMAQMAEEISRQAGKPIQYVDLPERDYCSILMSVGIPEVYSKVVADSDAKAAHGALHDESRQLSKLIGRSTTTLSAAISQALTQLSEV